MIDAWTWPAYVAVLLGGMLFVALFAPLLALQSRRFGRLTLSRTIALALFSVYGVAIVSYTLLPFPARDWCATNASPPAQLRPFHSLDDIAESGSATSFAVLQVVFNVALFVPWGAFVRRYFGWSIAAATGSGFCVSLLVESTQGTGVWGVYGCAYRVADVDDLITNTTGALIGAALAPLLLGWVPPAAQDRRSRGEPRSVTLVRRLAGMAIDVVTLYLAMGVLTVTYRSIVHYGFGRPIPTSDQWTDQTLWGAVAFLLLTALPVLLGEPTPGQRAVWLTPVYPDHRLSRRVRRLLCGVGGWALLTLTLNAPPVRGAAATALEALSWGWIVATFLAVVLDRSRGGISFRAAGAEVADARATST